MKAFLLLHAEKSSDAASILYLRIFNADKFGIFLSARSFIMSAEQISQTLFFTIRSIGIIFIFITKENKAVNLSLSSFKKLFLRFAFLDFSRFIAYIDIAEAGHFNLPALFLFAYPFFEIFVLLGILIKGLFNGYNHGSTLQLGILLAYTFFYDKAGFIDSDWFGFSFFFAKRLFLLSEIGNANRFFAVLFILRKIAVRFKLIVKSITLFRKKKSFLTV